MNLHTPITHTGAICSRFRTISPVHSILVDVYVETSTVLQMGFILSMCPRCLLALEWNIKHALGKAIASHTGMLELSTLITVLERPYC